VARTFDEIDVESFGDQFTEPCGGLMLLVASDELA
jgi:hypothetical protein